MRYTRRVDRSGQRLAAHVREVKPVSGRRALDHAARASPGLGQRDAEFPRPGRDPVGPRKRIGEPFDSHLELASGARSWGAILVLGFLWLMIRNWGY
jgi:hypothetical protein